MLIKSSHSSTRDMECGVSLDLFLNGIFLGANVAERWFSSEAIAMPRVKLLN
jgi:hypothetical protein